MDLPTPEDPKRAPVWENYVVAQAAFAALRLIPDDALAMGVEVLGSKVTLVLQMSAESPSNDQDISDILSELEALLGQRVEVSTRIEVIDETRLHPDDGVRWFFAARA